MLVLGLNQLKSTLCLAVVYSMHNAFIPYIPKSSSDTCLHLFMLYAATSISFQLYVKPAVHIFFWISIPDVFGHPLCL